MIWWIRNNGALIGAVAVALTAGWLWHAAKVQTFETQVENAVRIKVIQAQAQLKADDIDERFEIDRENLSAIKGETDRAIREFKRAIDAQPEPVVKIDASVLADECDIFAQQLRDLGKAINTFDSP